MDPTVIAAAMIGGGGVIATAVLGLTGAVIGRVTKLEERVAAIESENKELRSLFQVAVSFIHRVGVWMEGSTDTRARPDIPEQLRDHIDVAPWGGEGPQPK